MTPERSVLLLTRNGGERFHRVLEKLFACDGIERTEVVQVDSGSTDGTWEATADRPVRRLRIDPAEFGHGRTRNLAAREAHGGLLVFLVQDAVPAGPDFLDRLTAPFAAPAVAGVHGRQLPRADANPVEEFYVGATYPDRGERRRRRDGREGARIRSLFFSNVASALRREVWRQIPFDEELIMSEDQQWARAALAAGHELVYEPRAAVVHSHNYTLGQLFRRNFDSGFSLRGVVDDSTLQMARYELGHLARGAAYLTRTRRPHWVPYLLLWELVRATAFATGRHALRLPAGWRRRLSAHRYYW